MTYELGAHIVEGCQVRRGRLEWLSCVLFGESVALGRPDLSIRAILIGAVCERVVPTPGGLTP